VKWIEEMYNKEIARLQPIIEAINSSPNGKIEINGYTCKKSSSGYKIGTDEYGLAMIEISSESNASRKQKFILYLKDIPLGGVRVSTNPGNMEVTTIGFKPLGKEYGKNTVLENALNFHYQNPDIDKERQLAVQQYLVMLEDLGLELTPTENMAMLRGKKQYLEEQLAEVNKELAQKESQEK